MKHLRCITTFALGAILMFSGTALGASVLQYYGGGTGTSTPGIAGQVNIIDSTGKIRIATSSLVVASSQFVGIGTTSPYSLLSVAGQIVAQNIYATSSIATSTFAGPVIIGDTLTPSLGGYLHSYLRVGSTTCPTNPTFYGLFEVCGNDNTTNGIQAQIGNTNPGANAFAGLSVLNNKSDTNLTNYAGIFLNSDAYTDATFGTAFAVKSQFQLVNSMGPIIIGTASTTAGEIIFNTGGFTTADEKMRLTPGGSLGLGTTSPSAKLSLQSSYTASSTPLFWANIIGSSTPSFYIGSPNQNGWIGIGTSAPLFNLDVVGKVNTDKYSGYYQDGRLLAYASTTNKSTIFGIGAGGQSATTSNSSSLNTTAFGYLAGNSLTAVGGNWNTAIGEEALFTATSTSANTAVGYNALWNSNGGDNTAVGYNTMGAVVNYGSRNVAIGSGVLSSLSSLGNNNTAIGYNALSGVNSGTGNTAVGHSAGSGFSGAGNAYNIFLGYGSANRITTGVNNTLLGVNTTGTAVNVITSGSNNIGIGFNAFFPSVSANNQLNIGNLIYGTIPATTTTYAFPTTGSVGIGSTSPYAKFAIHTNNGDTATTLFAIGSSTATATTTLFSVLNSGFVGVGATSSPGSLLSINGVANFTTGTTTFYGNGIDIPSNQCYSIASVCLPTLGGTNTWTSSNTFNGAFSSTNTFSALNSLGRFDFGNSGTSGTLRLSINSVTGTRVVFVPDLAGSLVIASSTLANGFVGLGTTTPFGMLSISPFAGISSFIIGSSTATVFHIDKFMHFIFGGGTPTLSAGTFIGSANDNIGKIKTVSGAGTTLTLTFSNSWGTAPTCLANFATTTSAIAGSTTPTTVVFTYASVNNVSLSYYCFGTP